LGGYVGETHSRIFPKRFPLRHPPAQAADADTRSAARAEVATPALNGEI